MLFPESFQEPFHRLTTTASEPPILRSINTAIRCNIARAFTGSMLKLALSLAKLPRRLCSCLRHCHVQRETADAITDALATADTPILLPLDRILIFHGCVSESFEMCFLWWLKAGMSQIAQRVRLYLVQLTIIMPVTRSGRSQTRDLELSRM
jgi:hypothetical protein